jgi:hypothetical protein
MVRIFWKILFENKENMIPPLSCKSNGTSFPRKYGIEGSRGFKIHWMRVLLSKRKKEKQNVICVLGGTLLIRDLHWIEWHFLKAYILAS